MNHPLVVWTVEDIILPSSMGITTGHYKDR